MLTPSSSTRLEPSQGGFSLIELLVAMGIAALLLTIGASSLRNYWLTQSVAGGADELVSQLRQAQEQAVSESHPKVFGVRLKTGSSTWALIEYNPTGPTCEEIQTNQFQSGARVRSQSFTTTAETTYCSSNLKFPGGAAVPDRNTSGYVWFYARGTAAPGSVVLENPLAPNIRPTITVTPITGRVTRS